ncbi:hypothetical protein ADIMK_3854 [Marinobacterium lacunae]|uniref:YjiS-like domain-containing protein n=1 Tax=Marinobacterium lacunae TaxID=1232683 RepID=A0A081FUI8_9GAMM|nr:DUF1127 domain-containing protein [Marinobacterium lacunae]KEA62193.1 hypothetical protein ADIMK_3854 [Marinobacterium lacunae]MBR9883157.1 DUF1127 domain-containing protein [Oceanospirillales bacterium]
MNCATNTFEPAGLQPKRIERARPISGLLKTLLLWHQRARQRRRLLALPPHMLKDIGISKADAVHEASKPFWK